MAAAAHAALPASCKLRAAGSAGAAQGRPLPSWPAAGAEHAMLFQPSRSDEVARRTPSTATTDDCELGSLRSRRRPPAGCLASIPTYVFSRSCTTFAWCARLFVNRPRVRTVGLSESSSAVPSSASWFLSAMLKIISCRCPPAGCKVVLTHLAAAHACWTGLLLWASQTCHHENVSPACFFRDNIN